MQGVTQRHYTTCCKYCFHKGSLLIYSDNPSYYSASYRTPESHLLEPGGLEVLLFK